MNHIPPPGIVDDADGNRLSQSVNGTTTTYQIDASSNRLDSFTAGSQVPVDLQYDAQGDLTFYAGSRSEAPSKQVASGSSAYGATGVTPSITAPGEPPPQQGITYHYNSFTRLDSVSGPTATNFDVSPEGQRLRKYTSTTSTYFAPDVGGKLLAEDINGTWYDYVYLNGRLVEVIANGGVFSLHDDQTGRPQVMTEPNGTSIDWAAQNKPFDRTVTTNAWGPFNVGFPGQYYDAEDDLWYNGHRDYDATLGRYIESDPIGLAGGINTYAYVESNPISLVDLLGLCTTCSQLQQQAAQLAKALEHTEHAAIALSGAGFVVAAAGGAGELETAGLDSGVTAFGANMGRTFATTALVTGGIAAGLQTFATNGDPRAITNFAVTMMIEKGTQIGTSDIPFLSNYSENIGQLAAQAAGLAASAPEVCQPQ